MLVLKRQFGSETYIDLEDGRRITIVIKRTVDPGVVNLLINAPPEIRLIRDNAKVLVAKPCI